MNPLDVLADDILPWLIAAVNPVGDPVEGMMGSAIVIVVTIVASFISFGATLVVTMVFMFVFIFHLIRFIWQEATGR